MFSRKEFVVMDENDNVGIVKQPVDKGQKLGPIGENSAEYVTLREDIPFGFKFALKDIKEGDEIIKFNEAIGLATVAIAKGELVHVHNIEGLRGRGDLDKGV